MTYRRNPSLPRPAHPTRLRAWHCGSKPRGASFDDFVRHLRTGEGINYLGPGIYFASSERSARAYCRYAGKPTLYEVEIDTRDYYDSASGEPQYMQRRLVAAMAEAGLPLDKQAPDTFRYGRHAIGLLNHRLGAEKALRLLLKHGIRGTLDWVHDFWEIAVFDPSTISVVNITEAPAVQRNPLLAKPPTALHRLQDTRSFRRLMKRAPQQSDYDGVHTTGSALVAGAYAMSAWNQHDREGYPVIVTLDVSGLEALPDVDALLRGAEQTDALLSHYRRQVEDGMGFWDLLDDEDYDEMSARAGDEPAAFIFEDIGNHMLQSIDSYASDEGLDAEDVFAAFLKTGELPPGVLTRMVDQQRYLNDFDLDRVVQIEALKPWWERVLLSWDDNEFKQLTKRGWEVFTLDEWPFSAGESKVVWKAPDAGKRKDTEYHGTTSLVIELAFPGLISAKSPFPIEGP